MKSAKAARKQTEEMKKQLSAINRPSVSAEIVYLKRMFWVLRFVNNGNKVSYSTKIILDEEFINSVDDDYKGTLKDLKNKVYTLGVDNTTIFSLGQMNKEVCQIKRILRGKLFLMILMEKNIQIILN